MRTDLGTIVEVESVGINGLIIENFTAYAEPHMSTEQGFEGQISHYIMRYATSAGSVVCCVGGGDISQAKDRLVRKMISTYHDLSNDKRLGMLGSVRKGYLDALEGLISKR